MQAHAKNRVCYYYNNEIGSYYFGKNHPMKPNRIRLTDDLVINYDLYRRMEIIWPYRATPEDMIKFHSKEYINFLHSICPANDMSVYGARMEKFSRGNDCPVFLGLFEYCQETTGGSVAAAVKLNEKSTDIAINWSGGFHHAKKSYASGFCYVNDIVLAILELLKHNQRVLYIDIDVHHGDGVEEAFYVTDRVMTCSFHRHDGDFFPGTGDIRDIGVGTGKNYSLNFPLREGIDDDSFQGIFSSVISKVMESYQPNVVVLQSGADSLTGDRLGCFNLTVKGHGKCLAFVKTFNLPLLVLGGGGYNTANVARCWAYETGVALGIDLANELPSHQFMDYYGPNYKLHISPDPDMRDKNKPTYLNRTTETILENLRRLPHAPSVQMQPIPDAAIIIDDGSPDERGAKRAKNKRVGCDGSDDDSKSRSKRQRTCYYENK